VTLHHDPASVFRSLFLAAFKFPSKEATVDDADNIRKPPYTESFLGEVPAIRD